MRSKEVICGPEDAKVAKDQQLENTWVWFRDSYLQASILERNQDHMLLLDHIDLGSADPYVTIQDNRELRFPYMVALIWSME